MNQSQEAKGDLNDYSVKIKEVLIELENYKYFHSPEAKAEEPVFDRFIGRQALINHIIALLDNSITESGSYLITGFRGMGKTSIVRKAIKSLNSQKRTEKEKHTFKIKLRNDTAFSYYIQKVLEIIFFVILTGSIYLFTIPYLNKLFFSYSFEPSLYEWWSQIIRGKFIYIQKDNYGVRLFGLFYLVLLTTSLIVLIYDFFKYKLNTWTSSELIPSSQYIKQFEINLSQNEVRDEDVLRQITIQLRDFWSNEISCFSELLTRKIYLFAWFPFIYFFKIYNFKKEITYKSVKIKLDQLTARLYSSVTLTSDSNSHVSYNGFLSARVGNNRSKKLSYPIASVKEVEVDLIQILDDISSIRKAKRRISAPKSVPKFVFVVDELDKIEPISTVSIRERESSDPYFDKEKSTGSSSSSITKIRQRQEAIGKLLANLKGFLNVAKAKFIFIGGREMYDASLADIADRDSFYSSIFHDVVYVNSFFKDRIGNKGGVTSMTEAYLCSIIIPSSFIDIKLKKLAEDGEFSSLETLQQKKEDLFNLKTFFEYLVQYFDKDNLSKNKIEIRYLPDRAKAYKTIALLQNFIIFLTYRSNGSPKKLSSLIERIIVQRSDKDLENKNKYLSIELPIKNKSKQRRFFLHFNFDAQYEIGLTSNIYRPYLINNSRINKLLGDKLLFSSAFIIDHILKFHPFGFSWRNLELIPEVILINKEPNLRGYIEELVRFLSKMHIRPTVSGIFQYKFFDKVKNELKLVSKISELGSAAFNFTLDESLHIKRHYKKKLEELERKYQKDDLDQFNHSIVLLQTILGDLHFYDKEYDDALLYYLQSMESVRIRKTVDKITKHQFLIWVRNKLKIGLTLEKMRAFDSAYSYYRKLILEIPYYLKKVVDKELLDDHELLDDYFGTDFKDEVSKRNLQHPSFRGIKPYRSLGLLIQPYIACLALIEKQRIDGLNIANLRKNEEEMNLLFKADYDKYRSKEKLFNMRMFFLRADYFNSLGAILYVKNRPFDKIFEDLELTKENNIWEENHFLELDHFVRGNRPKFENQDYRSALTAYIYYKKALINLIRPQVNHFVPEPKSEDEFSVYGAVIKLLFPENIHKINASKMYYIGNVISNLGNCILASLNNKQLCSVNKDTVEILENISKYRLEDPKFTYDYKYWQNLFANIDKKVNEKSSLLSINNVLVFHFIAGIYYLKAGRSNSYAFQFKKILYLISDGLKIQNKNFPGKFTDHFGRTQLLSYVENLGIKIIKANTWSTDISNRPQIQKYRQIFHLSNHSDTDRWAVYNSTTNAAEFREVIMLVETIKLSAYKLRNKFKHEEVPYDLSTYQGIPKLESSLISPYSNISSHYLRVLELKYRNDMYFFLIKEQMKIGWLLESRIDFDNNLPILKQEKRAIIEYFDIDLIKAEYIKMYAYGKELEINAKEFVAFVIREALFCNLMIIQTLRLFGIDFISSYSILGSAHERTGNWCVALENLENIFNKDTDKEFIKSNQQDLKELLDSETTYYLESNYHFEQAIQNYYNGIQLHTEGRTYRNHVLNLYCLEDDFHDNLSHFSIALERLRINTGSIRAKIDSLNERRNNSKLYDLGEYYPKDE